jgi:hypothetical protein
MRILRTNPLVVVFATLVAVVTLRAQDTSVVSLQPSTPIEFKNDVIPVLTKMGCNAGACHGAAIGRGGFSLSLYASKPDQDYDAIVRQLQGRRINLAAPNESLIFKKPAEYIQHGGGTIFAEDDASAQIVLNWIMQGAKKESSRTLKSIEISPRQYLAASVGESFELNASAHYSDGSTRDVTDWTIFTAEDPSAIKIDDENSSATVSRRGRQVIIARYLNQVVPIEVLVPLSDTPVDFSGQPRNNFVDDQVLQLLETLRLPPSPIADDAAFLRRITLDLTGRLPTQSQVDSFLQDNAPDKRQRLVDRLLDSEQFNEYWTYQLAKLLRIRPQLKDTTGAETYHHWLNEQISNDISYRSLARTLLSASGDTYEYGPAYFYQTTRGAREQAEFVSELFMGARLRCANCHDHPLDHWTQDDYHGLAAVFAQVESGRFIKDDPNGEVIHPSTLEPATPKLPGMAPFDTAVALANQHPYREQFADWLTDEQNPYFAKAIVNRLWKHMMGRGLVESPDDFRATNPATHPRLLDDLADDFVAHDYSLRHTLRVIANSATYARSCSTTGVNSNDDRFYSHGLRRTLEPEVLADAISDVLGIHERYGELPRGTRAVSLIHPNITSPSLDLLGRCGRDETCEGTIDTAGGLPQKLHMFNGQLLNARIAAPGGRLDNLLNAKKTSAEIIDTFYVVALGRHPTDAEKAHWNQALVQAENKQHFLEDFVWGILTSQEFTHNH